MGNGVKPEAPRGRQESLLLCAQAEECARRGDRLATIALAREALAFDPSCLNAHVLLANSSLEGEPYHALLARIHQHLKPRTYLEIGVARGGSIGLAGPETQAIGVDPEPQPAAPLPPNIRLYRETSDAFFERDLRAEFGGVPLDLALIDGMHLFEYALRDFMNVERNAVPGTRMLLHDCYPLDAPTSARERRTLFWTGDVWKVIACLKKYRPDLKICVFASPPTGLALIRGFDPGSRVLSENYAALCAEFVPLPYEAIERDKPGALNLVPGHWDTVRELMT
jgi:hypothetical protein